jgi:hypothetical protein
MDPGDAKFAVAIDDTQTRRRPFFGYRDSQSIGKCAFDHKARHNRISFRSKPDQERPGEVEFAGSACMAESGNSPIFSSFLP